MQVKKTNIRLKNKENRDGAETSVGAESIIWYILKRNALVSSATPKDLKNHIRQIKWIIVFFPLLKKSSLTTPSQVMNTFEEVGLSLSKSLSKRRLNECK